MGVQQLDGLEPVRRLIEIQKESLMLSARTSVAPRPAELTSFLDDSEAAELVLRVGTSRLAYGDTTIIGTRKPSPSIVDAAADVVVRSAPVVPDDHDVGDSQPALPDCVHDRRDPFRPVVTPRSGMIRVGDVGDDPRHRRQADRPRRVWGRARARRRSFNVAKYVGFGKGNAAIRAVEFRLVWPFALVVTYGVYRIERIP